MLVMYLLYVTKFINNTHIVFVVPDICCAENPTTCLNVVCSRPGPMSSPDTVSNLAVYNRIVQVLCLGIMIIFQLRHHITERLSVTVHTQSY